MKMRCLFLGALLFWIFLINVRGENYPHPPPGEVWGGYLEAMDETRSQLAQILGQVPSGEAGRASPSFAKLQKIQSLLDQAATSKLQTSLFALVPSLAGVLQEQNPPPFVAASIGPLANLSVPLIATAGTHVEQQKGAVAEAVLTSFVEMFAVNGLVSESNWEDRSMPVDAPGVLILDAAAVVAQLKTRPWRQARQFLNEATTAGGFFARYIGSGDGLAVLKTKYAANRAAIDAKFSELKAWADQQERQAEDSG